MTDDRAPRPRSDTTGEQRVLDAVVRVGGGLVLVGLTTAAVLIALHLTGRDTPDTWAYLVAMLAPVGLALILGSMLAMAVRRRRRTIAGHEDQEGSRAT